MGMFSCKKVDNTYVIKYNPQYYIGTWQNTMKTVINIYDFTDTTRDTFYYSLTKPVKKLIFKQNGELNIINYDTINMVEAIELTSWYIYQNRVRENDDDLMINNEYDGPITRTSDTSFVLENRKFSTYQTISKWEKIN